MLRITVPGPELWDEAHKEFTTQPGEVTLELEHSLASLSKWESKFEKPFLETKDRTPEEAIGYVKAMTLTPDVPDTVYERLSDENFKAINDYLGARMTATWFSDEPGPPAAKQIVTAELIYYWMTGYQIPFECQYWHLNRLFTLIRVCTLKQAKPKKMTRAELAERQRQLNEQRRAALGTSG